MNRIVARENKNAPDESAASPSSDVEYVLTAGNRKRLGMLHILRNALQEFLGVPLAIVAGLIVLGFVTYLLDRTTPIWLETLLQFLTQHIFKDSSVTETLLDMMGGGILTMTSIIVSMLLLVLQQSAGNMGNMVYDQFLQRRSNQIYAGLVVGTVVLVLWVSSTVSEDFNPVLSATVALALVILIVILLLFFLYFTIEQMRPEVIISAIHHRTLAARQKQLDLLKRIRSQPEMDYSERVELRSTTNGYIINLDLDHMKRCLDAAEAPAEIVMRKSIGAYVHYFECIAEVWSGSRHVARQVAEGAGEAIGLADMREMTVDPAFGLEQLEMTAWTEISSAKHNPETGLLVNYVLRDILSRWIREDPPLTDEVIAVVYRDNFPPDVMDVLESLAAAAVEGKQHQNMSEIFMTLKLLYNELNPDLQDRAENLVLRALPALDGFLRTQKFSQEMLSLAACLDRAGRKATARKLAGASQPPARMF